MAAFVKKILLEEGAPRIVRCDNGSEFKNKTTNELRLLMRSELQYSPAYWPQSNQCERTNRQVDDEGEPGAAGFVAPGSPLRRR